MTPKQIEGSIKTQVTRGERPEIQLLLCCARSCVDLKTAEQIRILVHDEIDWIYLIRMAQQHKVMPLLYWSLNKICSQAVPKDILNQLRNLFHAQALRNMFLTKELFKLLTLFNTHEIPILSFKGPILAASAYANLALRQFSDLDILVREQDILRARALLISQGYQMKIHPIKLTEAQEAKFVRSPQVHQLVRECAYPFVNCHNQVLVELHWAVMPKYISFPIDSQHLWEDLEPVSIADKTVFNLSPENALLILCAHGAKDCWVEMARICDVAELIGSHPQLDWKKLMTQASQLGGERILFLGLFLANDLLGTLLPTSVQQRIQADSVLIRLATQVRERLFYEPEVLPRIGEISPFHLSVRERVQDKIHFCLRVAFNPTTSDWILLPLAVFPSFLYYLIRPIRLARNFVLSIRDRVRQLSL
ncbi:MAG TPA: hypothetical protein DDW76_09310 [Cyanobacteria bacterium UBA11369]|nr:hypothetical protein [Cyanobacteria bacterium UBA11371]HBE35637.1 hypothetical protein [Cyanobacteria bacterium UBA11368]HBE48977.1 hypothetical protein [Cyanobacteria bacterium UBA11369]